VSSGKAKKIVLSYGIVADEVRYEHNGKLLIIGVYTGDILVNKIPSSLNFTLSCFGEANEVTKVEIGVRVLDDRKDILFHADPYGLLETSQTGPVNVSLPNIVLAIARTGTVRFEVKVGDAPWRRLAEKRINLGNVAQGPVTHVESPERH